jgi:hypothetical protein
MQMLFILKEPLSYARLLSFLENFIQSMISFSLRIPQIWHDNNRHNEIQKILKVNKP